MEELNPTPDSQLESAVFSVRIVSIDYYMAPPIPGVDICYSSFQGEKVNELPVIRIYGSTPAGQKTCLHVHQAFPYLYVPCADIPLSVLEEDAYKHKVYLAMEKALKLKGNSGAKRRHVHGCNLVRARRLYGYYASEELFVKIYLYHPHDVSRAAKLLLGGAVFDRSVQPHEAHIPYLLQFMVDYNLYGMGHLHVTKMKFRHPTPGSTFSKRINDHMQADSSTKAHLRSTVWITSTIPHDWRWPIHDDLDSSVGNKPYVVKRQSICELEGDVVVDDILNQHLKTYTSLSQARSDVKMVQSLVPIWEEELERNGAQEAPLPDPGKPGPQDVLKVLSHGLGLENKFMELCIEAENNLTPSQHNFRYLSSTLLSSSERKLTDSEIANSSKTCGEHSGQFIVKDDSLSTQYLSYDRKINLMLAKGSDACYEPFIHGRESSTSKLESEVKVADREALGLLKWLAATQAVEEINSDDELAREIILSPLLPTTNADKVLEKANMDYESESQRECLDILDSIDEDLGVEDQKDRLFRDSCQPSKEKIIPQVNGSGDDPSYSGGAVETPSKSEKKIENSIMERQALHDAGISSAGKRKLKGPSWGNLPFSSAKEDDDNVHTNFSMSDGFSTEGDYQSSDDSGFNRHVENCLSTSEKIEHLKDAGVPDGCSVRDLMRKKRKSQVLPPEEQKLNVISCPERTSLHFSDDKESTILYSSCPGNQKSLHELSDVEHIRSVDFAEDLSVINKLNSDSVGFLVMHGEECPSIRNKSMVSDILTFTSDKLVPEEVGNPVLQRKDPISRSFIESSLADKDAKSIGSQCWGRMLRACLSEKTLENPYVYDTITKATVTQSSDHNEHELREDAGLSTVDARTSTSLITLTLHEKHVNLNCDDEASEGDQSAKATVYHAFPRQRNIHKVPEGLLEDVLPSDYREGKQLLSRRSTDDKSSYCGMAMMGVPTCCMNDGSQLYLLKPVIPPPSSESVTSWLHNEEGASCKAKVSKMLALPLKGSSESLVNSTRSLFCEATETTADHGSLSHTICSSVVIHHDEQGDQNAKIDTHCSGPIIKFHAEESTLKREAYNNISQDISQISGPDGKSGSTPLSQLGFRDPASVGAGQQLTLISLEVQPESRGDLRPDPRFDAINVLALAIMGDDEADIELFVLLNCRSESYQRSRDGLSGCKVMYFPEEKKLIINFVKIINDLNPDILIGWDVQGGSLGFLAERASYLGIGLLNLISRTPSESKIAAGGPDQGDMKLLENVASESSTSGDAVIEDEWGRTHASGVHVGGRIVLNLWRLTRGEIKLNLYTIEAVAEAVLRLKIPSIQNKTLTKWFSTGSGRARYRCIEYVTKRVKLNFEIMNQLDLVNRTSELARVFGIDFFSVLSRGSQYRVESMLLRLARTQNYVAISPGVQQVASQPAMECIPLVMEPESGFYEDPVVVLDFQSLYPSMIIAYNLCFCTSLGKITPSKDNILGVTSYSADPDALRNLKDRLLLTPNGVIYVPTEVREGILPRLLEEILLTRIMIKQAMRKLGPSQHVLRRIFNARQLALKLIANVTYGYTAAGFSGRMPCAELADSIVQCGRKTLETAISYVNAQSNWKARVIYGDTDSMFVILKGRTVKEAFQIGQEIASAISGMNPEPVTLKMEKVYHPCFLLTKKRYVGYSYESPDQVEPTFDAKGIETVRRDTCPAVAKAMEQSLRLYFEHQDISEVKSYLHRQWTRILSGRISLQDFVFAKEVRLGTYSTRSSSLPPAAIVATKAMKIDSRAEPRYAERIPYMVVHGEPGARLVDMVVDPLDVLALDSPYRLNGQYYITKQIIPALQRIFGLVGADLNQWYLEMPRPARESYAKRPIYVQNAQRTRIDYYYASRHCVLCGELVPNTMSNLCSRCLQKDSVVAAALTGKTAKLEKEMQHLTEICNHCGGGDWIVESGIKCTSLACPVFYERRKVQKEAMSLSTVATKEGLYPNCTFEWF